MGMWGEKFPEVWEWGSAPPGLCSGPSSWSSLPGQRVGAQKGHEEGSGPVGSREAFPRDAFVLQEPPAQQHSLTWVMPSLAAFSPGLAHPCCPELQGE